MTGYTGNYIKIYLPERVSVGKKYTVEITEIFRDGALAKLV